MNKKRTNMIIAVAVILVALVVSIVNPADSVKFVIEENVLCINGPDEFSYSVPMEQVRKYELVKDLDYAVVGEKEKGVVCGTYSNEELGEHVQCLYTAIPVCIAVHSPDGVILFNVESEETTERLYQALLEYSEQTE